MKKNCGLDLKCKKCDFEIYSEGLLRIYKVKIHNLKEFTENIILGFENDVKEHVNLLKSMEDEVKTLCNDCEFKTHTKCKLQIHRNGNH